MNAMLSRGLLGLASLRLTVACFAVLAAVVLAAQADTRFGGRLIDRRRVHLAIDADHAFVPIARIGGERGWYFATWLWRIRGAVDLLMGGVGWLERRSARAG